MLVTYFLDAYVDNPDLSYKMLKNTIIEHQKLHGDLVVAAGISSTDSEKYLGYLLKHNFKFMTYIKVRIIAFRLLRAIRKYKKGR